MELEAGDFVTIEDQEVKEVMQTGYNDEGDFTLFTTYWYGTELPKGFMESHFVDIVKDILDENKTVCFEKANGESKEY